jgi:DNA recombination protein RmuC
MPDPAQRWCTALRTVAHGWSHEALAERARDIHRLGRDLHTRLATLGSHLDRVGRSLNSAVGHYNQAMGSLESRVLVSARRFTELSVTDDDLPTPRPVTLRAVDLPARRGTSGEEGEGPTVAL